MAVGLLMLAAVGALVAGCTAGGGARPPGTATPPGAPAATTTPSPTTSGEPTPLPGGQKIAIKVFFSMETTGVRDGQEVAGEKLVGVTRLVPSGTWLLQDAAELWLAGPTAAEKAEGLSLATPPGLKLRSVKLQKGGVVTVDLPKAAAPPGGTAATINTLGQLVYTMTAQPGVRAVRIALDGVLVKEFGGEGLDVSKPLTRADVADYFLP